MKNDLRWMSGHIENLTRELERSTAQLRALQGELGTEEPTRPLSVAELKSRLRRQAPDMIKARNPQGFTIMLPVGNRQARHA